MLPNRSIWLGPIITWRLPPQIMSKIARKGTQPSTGPGAGSPTGQQPATTEAQAGGLAYVTARNGAVPTAEPRRDPGSTVAVRDRALVAVVLQRALTGAHPSAALAHGFQQSFWWAVIFTAIAVLVSLLLPGKPSAEGP